MHDTCPLQVEYIEKSVGSFMNIMKIVEQSFVYFLSERLFI